MPDPIVLTPAEARVLGALIEKQVTTPEYYPLSLHALGSAANQRSNRDPVMNLDEDQLREALGGLEEKRLAGPARSAEGRVTKYEHWMGEAFNLSRAEAALVCTLLLRGAQTPGELRGRSERLYRFEEIRDVVAGLEKLMEREPPLAAVLPRQPGAREARYAHLLSGPAAPVPADDDASSTDDPSGYGQRIAELERETAALRQAIEDLRDRFREKFGEKPGASPG